MNYEILPYVLLFAGMGFCGLSVAALAINSNQDNESGDL